MIGDPLFILGFIALSVIAIYAMTVLLDRPRDGHAGPPERERLP